MDATRYGIQHCATEWAYSSGRAYPDPFNDVELDLVIAEPVSANRRFLEHRDGTPFFWLGDTWWMGLCKRLRWPDDFRVLLADRVAKGFSVIQIVAGLYPDMPAFDGRGANEASFPWDREYRRINPAYFDAADLRIQDLVRAGLVLCIVGCSGYFVRWMGTARLKQHWNASPERLPPSRRCRSSTGKCVTRAFWRTAGRRFSA